MTDLNVSENEMLVVDARFLFLKTYFVPWV